MSLEDSSNALLHSDTVDGTYILTNLFKLFNLL